MMVPTAAHTIILITARIILIMRLRQKTIRHLTIHPLLAPLMKAQAVLNKQNDKNPFGQRPKGFFSTII